MDSGGAKRGGIAMGRGVRRPVDDGFGNGESVVELDKFQRFEKWLRDNGGEFDMLEMRSYNDSSTGVSEDETEEEEGCAYSSDTDEEKKDPTKDNGGTSGGDIAETSLANKRNGRGGDKDSSSSEMRGVHSKQVIPPNTVCVAVPRKCLIIVEMGMATDIGQRILSSDLDLDAPKHIFLMIYLLWDRKVNGSKSFFKPYYDILPPTLRNMPIFWSSEELGYLEGSYLLTQIADRDDAITEDYVAICDVAPELAEIATLEEFKWARMCVCSRNFGLQIEGHRTSALVPYADMLNHHRPRETKWTYDDDRKAFTITTLQTIASGAQVYDSYGQKCNHRFLLNYGFAVEDNREVDGFCPNEVPVELDLASDDPIYDTKYEFWTRTEGSSSAQRDQVIPNPTAAPSPHRFGDSVLVDGSGEADSASVPSSQQLSTASPAKIASGSLNNRTPVPTPQHRGRSQSVNSDSTLPTVKRVRVCVSNNENTRILFSMLRVLACNEDELRSISAPPPPAVTGDTGCPAYVSRALLGLSPLAGTAPGSSVTATVNQRMRASSVLSSVVASAGSSAFFRTCRDVRHPLCVRNERAAMELLLDVISRSLAKYPTTLSQDLKDLADEKSYPRFSNKRHAKIQVRGEKEVLHHFSRWARTALEVLGAIDNELKEERDRLVAADGGSIGRTMDQFSSRREAEAPTGFEFVVRDMESKEGVMGGYHSTIVRYCTEVLGGLRREEVKRIRRSVLASRVGPMAASSASEALDQHSIQSFSSASSSFI